jgi:thioredoxin-like negative regulator of GroEL
LPPALKAHPPIQRLADRLALILAARRAPPVAELEAALAGLAELVKRDPEHQEGIPRRALGSVLDLPDPADERVRRYRRTLFAY